MKKIRIVNKDFVRFMSNKEDDGFKDRLTGLRNRQGMYKDYKSQPHGKVITILLIDIDYFRKINDKYGYSEADKVLVAVAEYLENTIKNSSIYRIGSDKFAVAFVDRNSETEIIAKASTLMNEFSAEGLASGIVDNLTFSIGVLLNQSCEEKIDVVIKKCESALAKAKERGRNTCVIFNSIEKEYDKSSEIEEEMKAAFSHNEFVPYLLPEVNSKTGELCGAEFLIRWNHWLDGIRHPKDFLDVLEKNGFITEIDLFMFEEACRMKDIWKFFEFSSINVSVNLSSVTLLRKNTVNELVKLAAKYSVSAKEITIDVSESDFETDPEGIGKVVAKLREKGFDVAVDRFGTGAFSLELMKRISGLKVKFAPEFVQSIVSDEQAKKFFDLISVVCKDENSTLIAVGAETPEDREKLSAMGFATVEGFCNAKPMPVEEFVKYALDNRYQVRSSSVS